MMWVLTSVVVKVLVDLFGGGCGVVWVWWWCGGGCGVVLCVRVCIGGVG